MYFLGLVPPELAQALAWTSDAEGLVLIADQIQLSPDFLRRQVSSTYVSEGCSGVFSSHAASTAGPVLADGRGRCSHSIIGSTLILDNARRTLWYIVVGYLIVSGIQGYLDTLGCLIVSGI